MLERIYIFWGVNMKISLKKILFIVAALSFIILLLIFPGIGRKGAADGLVLCGGVVIPSLFPFTFCVLLLMRSGIEKYLAKLDRLTVILFRLSGTQFAVFLLSLIGGYPVGARLVEELYSRRTADRKTARTMLCCCVNSGPAFTVLFAGEGILGSKTLGYCLLAAHIISSFVLLLLLRGKFAHSDMPDKRGNTAVPLSENFVNSAADAASSMISICGFVILFSTLNAYILNFTPIRNAAYFTEVTGGISLTRNIYFISFLLGFGGISVWLQVISAVRKTGVDIAPFIIFRILHGTFSAVTTFIITKAFGISVATISNGVSFDSRYFYSSAAVGIALLIMILIFFISLFGKNHSGNLMKDML